LDITDESERQADAEHALARIEATTLVLVFPNENPTTVTETDPELGTFAGVPEITAGLLKENCPDNTDARTATLRMTF